MHPSIPSSLSNRNEGGIEDNQPTQTSFRFDPTPPLTTMRAPTILCWYTSTFLSFHLTSAAPGGRGGREGGVAVAIDFGAVTEKFPLPDASQQQQQQQVVAAKTLQREQKISKSQRPEPVRLWIDDFGNIEAVPVVSKAGLDDDSSSSSSSSSSTEKSAPGSSGIKQPPPPSQPPNPQKKNHHLAPPAPAPAPAPRQQRQRQQQRQLQDFRTTERAIINWKWPSTFSGLSGILYFVFGSILLLGGLITLALSLSTRRRNIRILGMGHRRGRSRFSL